MAEVAAVIVAAGTGSRVGGDLPKQFRPIGGESILRRALKIFADHGEVAFVQPVIRAEDAEIYRKQTVRLDLLPEVFGGATRQCSVRAGLEALAARKPDIVLIHDAARPFASPALGVARNRGRRANRCRDPGAAGYRHRQDRRCRRPR